MKFEEISEEIVDSYLSFPLFLTEEKVWLPGVQLSLGDVYELQAAGYSHVFLDSKPEEPPETVVLLSSVRELITDVLDNRLIQIIESSDYGSMLLNSLYRYDECTFMHSVDVARLMYQMSTILDYKDLGCLRLALAGLFHDIGKCCIPKCLLNHEGALDPEARYVMKEHVWYSYLIIRTKWNSEMAPLVYSHHERADGSGYPCRLVGLYTDEVMLSICDVFSALMQKRPYKESMSIEEAFSIINNDFKGEEKLISVLHEVVGNGGIYA